MKYKPLGKLNHTSEFKINDLINLLLENRGIETKKEKELFLNPKLSYVNLESAGINPNDIEKAKKRIVQAIKKKEQIIVFGDYDVDGICGTAILWETLNKLGANVLPYIPHRTEEGYGLSIKGIENIKKKLSPKLIITVDNGVVANEAVDFANKEGIDVIITDHHTFETKKPKALAIIHTKKLCGAGVAWLFSKSLGSKDESHLELVALATIADLVPLNGLNRAIVKSGLEKLKQTKRLGLLELFNEAGIDASKQIGTYEIGHIIAPRINAMGRMEYAMDSLRLLCTFSKVRAKELAEKLGNTNRTRQNLTEETTLLALEEARATVGNKRLVFISSEKYNQGIIGLVAGKLVEEFYLPVIVVSKGKKLSKASARSISGFDIVEGIRSFSSLLVDIGGHPMAAGFTVETKKLNLLQKKLENLAEKTITPDLLIKEIKIDCEIILKAVNLELFEELEKLEPFGLGNPTPTFLSIGLTVQDMRLVGADGKHLKLLLKDGKTGTIVNAIAFGFGKKTKELKIGDKVNVIYTILRDEWNGNRRIQLKIKDLSEAQQALAVGM